jgi:hypothetical protein
MIRTIHRVYLISNFDKEEEWLNEMATKGWHLRSVGLMTYVFEEGEPGAYIYRLELLDNLPGHFESRRYISFLEETGAELIGSIARWVYFRKLNDGRGFDLYSDAASRIRHLNRILLFISVISGLCLINTSNMLRMWTTYESGIYLAMLIFFLVFGMLFIYGFVRIYMKRKRLKEESVLHE